MLSAADRKERSAAQEHFIDLCRLLGEPTPAEADPKGEWFCFERGASKAAGGEGWADVWKRGHFGWEYKGRRKDLNAALGQLQQYALALENPPLLVVCDLDRFRIHTSFTNTVSQVHEIALEDLRDAAVRQKLKWVLSEPARLRPGKTRQTLTEEVAAEFARLAQRLAVLCGPIISAWSDQMLDPKWGHCATSLGCLSPGYDAVPPTWGSNFDPWDAKSGSYTAPGRRPMPVQPKP